MDKCNKHRFLREKGKREGSPLPPLPNPPPLFPFLPIPYPLPLSTPATEANFWVVIFFCGVNGVEKGGEWAINLRSGGPSSLSLSLGGYG